MVPVRLHVFDMAGELQSPAFCIAAQFLCLCQQGGLLVPRGPQCLLCLPPVCARTLIGGLRRLLLRLLQPSVHGTAARTLLAVCVRRITWHARIRGVCPGSLQMPQRLAAVAQAQAQGGGLPLLAVKLLLYGCQPRLD